MKNKKYTLSNNSIKIQRLPMIEIQLIFEIANHFKHLRTIVSFLSKYKNIYTIHRLIALVVCSSFENKYFIISEN